MTQPASAACVAEAPPLPQGVELWPLTPHRDDRGSFTELFRAAWPMGFEPAQWGHLMSDPGVLRGMHVHPVHDEFITVTNGRVFVALKDLRPHSPTYLMAAQLIMAEDEPALLRLPHGVAHAFYAATQASVLIAASREYDPGDDLGCHWSDPALGIDWPCTAPILSERDRTAPRLQALIEQLARCERPPTGRSPMAPP
ncbi:MAG: dTDP-4-dehydrorhamnose 3,5-epimerase family protein [Pseudomonadota bacterium]